VFISSSPNELPLDLLILLKIIHNNLRRRTVLNIIDQNIHINKDLLPICREMSPRNIAQSIFTNRILNTFRVWLATVPNLEFERFILEVLNRTVEFALSVNREYY
jgi:hypothetical protein